MLRIERHYTRLYVATYGDFHAMNYCPLRAAAHVLRLAAGMEERR